MDILPRGWFETSAHSLVRRAHATCSGLSRDIPYTPTWWSEPDLLLAQWLIIGTCVIAAIIFMLMMYTFKVILTLCIVEDSPAIYLVATPEDASNLKLKPTGAPGIYTPKTYVTDSIRGTIRHLRSKAGVFSAWRGCSAHIALIFAIVVLRIILRSVFGIFLRPFLAGPAAEFSSLVLLARFSMTVTHIIISKNQKNTTWLSRISATPWSVARRTVPAMAHFALASIIGKELCKYGINTTAHIGVGTIFFISGAFVNLFIAFPIMVALIRVQASLLPDSQEGIISFDRTFGKAGGTMGLSYQEALKSVGCAGWKRITKLAAKFLGIAFGFTVIFGVIFAIEISVLVYSLDLIS